MAVVASLLLPSASVSQDLEQLPELIKSTKGEHPRIFIRSAELPQLKQRITSDPLLVDANRLLIRQADSLLDEAPVERVVTGRRDAKRLS